MTVRRIVPDDWETWRDARLTSLADAPYAFGSTLALEQQFDEADWRLRLRPENGMAAVTFLGEDAMGTIGAYLPEDADDPLLVAAWVHADARGTGVRDAVVAEVLDWSREGGYEQVYLRVADGNQAARELFLRNGFTSTGIRMPLESDPSVGTEFLVRNCRSPQVRSGHAYAIGLTLDRRSAAQRRDRSTPHPPAQAHRP